VLFYVFFFVTFPVLFVCICVLNYCHRVATQLQLNISYHTYLCQRQRYERTNSITYSHMEQ